MSSLFRAVSFIAILSVLTSCADTRKLTYFNDVPDTEIATNVENLEPVIQKNDLLSISVSSLSPEASQIFNTPNTSGTVAGNKSSSGYLVDPDGHIQFPVLGNIKAAGLTKMALKDTILKAIKEKNLLLDPIVNIRYLNYKVSVLGEVARPTLIDVPGEKISLLEALSLAGDLTLYAKRNNVVLIREEDDKKIIRHLDLTNQKFLTSPYYYLKSNDVVYVAPNKVRVSSTSPAWRWMPIILSSISVLSWAVYRLR